MKTQEHYEASLLAQAQVMAKMRELILIEADDLVTFKPESYLDNGEKFICETGYRIKDALALPESPAEKRVKAMMEALKTYANKATWGVGACTNVMVVGVKGKVHGWELAEEVLAACEGEK